MIKHAAHHIDTGSLKLSWIVICETYFYWNVEFCSATAQLAAVQQSAPVAECRGGYLFRIPSSQSEAGSLFLSIVENFNGSSGPGRGCCGELGY